MALLPEPLGIIPAQIHGLFRSKILFFMGVQVLFHLLYDMFGIVIVLHFQICRNFCDFVRVTAGRAEFPLLEPVHVRKGPAPRTPEDMVHNYVVISASLIKIYWYSYISSETDSSGHLFRCRNYQVRISRPGVLTGRQNIKRNPYIVRSTHRTGTMENIVVTGIRGLPLIRAGDNLAAMICERVKVEDGDIISLASTVYSKSKGYTKPLAQITPSERAQRLAKLNGEDPRFVQAVLDASQDIIMEHPFILSELSFGHIGVRAGVDQSNIDDGMVIFLPPDPMKAAAEVRDEIKTITGKNAGVIITDTCGRSFRRGQTGHAIGWSGFTAIRDFRGDTDLFGHELKITEEAVVDEIAGFANFMMGESNNGVPAVHFRNCPSWTGHDNLYFSKDEDITRRLLKTTCQS